MKDEKSNEGGYTLPTSLLSIAQCFPPAGSDPIQDSESHRSRLPETLSRCKTCLCDYQLTDDETIIASILLEQLLEGKPSCNVMDIIARVTNNRLERFTKLQAVRSMQQKGILAIEGRGFKVPAGANPEKYPMTLSQLVQAEIALNSRFLDDVFCTTTVSPAVSELPYSSKRDYLDDWFLYVDALQKSRCCADCDLDGMDRRDLQDVARRTRCKIERRLLASQIKFPLDGIVADYGLDETERNLLVYLLLHDLRGETAQIDDVIGFMSDTPFDRVAKREYLAPTSKLRSNGLIETEQDSPFLRRFREVSLNPDIAARLLDSDISGAKNQLQHLLQNQWIFKLEVPCQTIDDVVLPASLMKALMTGIKRYEGGIDATLRAWGLERSHIPVKSGDLDEAPLLILLSGPSGTGKTFVAGAIADYLGKSLVTTDISKLLSCWIGESEQNVRKMLDLHAEIIRRCPNPPVLFLNECDQFLQERGNARSSASRMYNQMQNLLLEGLERMRGVMIATTNLTGNMDEAFSRRFHLKLEFPKPDFHARVALWQKHLLPTIPRADDVNIDFLARLREFTGGQIAVAVRNAAVEAAVRGDVLRMSDLLTASQVEAQGVLDHSPQFKGQIGFSKNNGQRTSSCRMTKSK